MSLVMTNGLSKFEGLDELKILVLLLIYHYKLFVKAYLMIIILSTNILRNYLL